MDFAVQLIGYSDADLDVAAIIEPPYADDEWIDNLEKTATYIQFLSRQQAEADGGDPLLLTLDQLRRQRFEIEHQMVLLVAYMRERVKPRPYTLAAIAEAAGLSISGTRTFYDPEDLKTLDQRVAHAKDAVIAAHANRGTSPGVPTVPVPGVEASMTRVDRHAAVRDDDTHNAMTDVTSATGPEADRPRSTTGSAGESTLNPPPMEVCFGLLSDLPPHVLAATANRGDPSCDRALNTIHSEQLDNLLSLVLNTRQQRVALALLHGDQPSEIARREHMTPSRVNQIRVEIRRVIALALSAPQNYVDVDGCTPLQKVIQDWVSLAADEASERRKLANERKALAVRQEREAQRLRASREADFRAHATTYITQGRVTPAGRLGEPVIVVRPGLTLKRGIIVGVPKHGLLRVTAGGKERSVPLRRLRATLDTPRSELAIDNLLGDSEMDPDQLREFDKLIRRSAEGQPQHMLALAHRTPDGRQGPV